MKYRQQGFVLRNFTKKGTPWFIYNGVRSTARDAREYVTKGSEDPAEEWKKWRRDGWRVVKVIITEAD